MQQHSRKALIAFSGPPLIGKTALAAAVSQRTGIRSIDVDEVRGEILPETFGILHSKGQERELMLKSYVEMYSRVKGCLEQGEAIIAVGTHSREAYHAMASGVARETQSPFLFVLLDPAKIKDIDAFLDQRIESRTMKGEKNSAIQGVAGKDRVKNDDYQRFVEIDGSLVQKLIRVDPSLPVEESAALVSSELISCLSGIRRHGG